MKYLPTLLLLLLLTCEVFDPKPDQHEEERTLKRLLYGSPCGLNPYSCSVLPEGIRITSEKDGCRNIEYDFCGDTKYMQCDYNGKQC